MTQAEQIEAEILGACLLDDEALLQALDELLPEMFTGRNQAIFEAMQVVGRADIVLITDHYRKINKDGAAGYISSLVAAATIYHLVSEHLGILKREYAKRRLLAAARDINGITQTDDDAAVMISRAEELVYQISESGMHGKVVTMCDAVSSQWKLYEGAPVVGITTGYTALDDVLTGMQPAELIVIAARPSMGKTDVSLNIARNTAKAGTRVLIFSLEMTRETLTIRSIAAEAYVNSQHYRLKALEPDEKQRAYAASAVLMDLPISIDDSSGLSVAEIRSKARRQKAQNGLDLVIIDYLQLISMNDKKRTRNEAVGEAARMLKAMGKELNVPVILLSQLSREVEKRQSKVPILSDLRDSGEIEQSADVVIFPHRPDYYDPAKSPGILELYIAKQRNGPVGKVTLIYNRRYNRIEPLTMVDKAKGVFGGVEGRGASEGA